MSTPYSPRARGTLLIARGRHYKYNHEPLRDHFRQPARRGPAKGDRIACFWFALRSARSDPARRDGLGQDIHDGERDPADRKADARDRAQQDARRTAVQRVPRAVPELIRQLFCLVLRLLSAGGVHAVERYLYRQGGVDQR